MPEQQSPEQLSPGSYKTTSCRHQSFVLIRNNILSDHFVSERNVIKFDLIGDSISRVKVSWCGLADFVSKLRH